MSVRPHDLAVQISAARDLETFRLPLDAARRKAREVINNPTRNGLTSVVRAGPKFEIVAENALNDYSLSSPAISNGQIFIRTSQTLYCIGKK